jgi:hypothetical protein
LRYVEYVQGGMKMMHVPKYSRRFGRPGLFSPHSMFPGGEYIADLKK